MADSLSKATQKRRQHSNTYKGMEGKIELSTKNSMPSKHKSRHQGKIKRFSDRQKLEKFITSKFMLQQMQAEGK